MGSFVGCQKLTGQRCWELPNYREKPITRPKAIDARSPVIAKDQTEAAPSRVSPNASAPLRNRFWIPKDVDSNVGASAHDEADPAIKDAPGNIVNLRRSSGDGKRKEIPKKRKQHALPDSEGEELRQGHGPVTRRGGAKRARLVGGAVGDDEPTASGHGSGGEEMDEEGEAEEDENGSDRNERRVLFGVKSKGEDTIPPLIGTAEDPASRGLNLKIKQSGGRGFPAGSITQSESSSTRSAASWCIPRAIPAEVDTRLNSGKAIPTAPTHPSYNAAHCLGTTLHRRPDTGSTVVSPNSYISPFADSGPAPIIPGAAARHQLPAMPPLFSADHVPQPLPLMAIPASVDDVVRSLGPMCFAFGDPGVDDG